MSTRHLSRSAVLCLVVSVTLTSFMEFELDAQTPPMRVFMEVDPGTESCDAAHLADVDALYFRPPEHLVVDQDWRPIEPIRDAARRARGNDRLLMDVLAESALQYYIATYGSGLTAPPEDFSVAQRLDLARALADVTVTGRGAWALFQRTTPQQEDLIPLAAFKLMIRGVTASPEDVQAAARFTLDRAYQVAHFLRRPTVFTPRARRLLGWIAVSAEDDRPHRPVNVPSASNSPGASFTQHDVTLLVQDMPIQTRFIAASAGQTCEGSAFPEGHDLGFPSPFGAGSDDQYVTDPNHDPLFDDGEPFPQVDPDVLEELELFPAWLEAFVASEVLEFLDLGEGYLLPLDPVACIPPENDVIIFIHGHTSRLEEAMDLIPHLHREARDRGRPVTILAMDLPCNGYASMFNHQRVAPTDDSMWHLSPAGSLTSSSTYPVLDFIEEFIVAFVNEMDRQFAIKDRIVAVIGGSLGGNMGLRLGERGYAWAHTVASWSPASTFGESWGGATSSLVTATREYYYYDIAKEAAVWFAEGELNEWVEEPHLREDYFHNVFRRPPLSNQADRWYRGGDWQACKDAYIDHATFERREIYNRWFRLWHWRVAYEQLLFSHYDQISRSDDTRRFELIRSRTLLLAGEEDNSGPDKLHDRVAEMAERMVNTPGDALFLQNTGHSIHAERPSFLAAKIIDFLR